MYKDMEERIKDFLRASIEGKLKAFDFEEFFSEFEGLLKNKLSEHGLLDFEDFRERQEELYSFRDLEEYTIKTDYVYFDIENVKIAIIKGQFEAMKDAFENNGTFEDLKKLYEKLQNRNGLKLKEKTLLFDECIHAEHVTGNIIEDVNIDDLKQEIEKEFSEGFLTV